MTNKADIQNYINQRANLLKALNEFPVEKREEVLFDKWSLKDLLAHINGWDEFLLKAVVNLKSNSQKDEFPATGEEVNEISVSSREQMSWDEVYKEFESYGIILSNKLESISEEEWSKPLWSNNDMSTKDFVIMLTGHINDEHLPLVKSIT